MSLPRDGYNSTAISDGSFLYRVPHAIPTTAKEEIIALGFNSTSTSPSPVHEQPQVSVEGVILLPAAATVPFVLWADDRRHGFESLRGHEVYDASDNRAVNQADKTLSPSRYTQRADAGDVVITCTATGSPDILFNMLCENPPAHASTDICDAIRIFLASRAELGLILLNNRNDATGKPQPHAVRLERCLDRFEPPSHKCTASQSS